MGELKRLDQALLLELTELTACRKGERPLESGKCPFVIL